MVSYNALNTSPVLFGCLIIFQSCSNVFYNHANKTEKVTVKVKPFK